MLENTLRLEMYEIKLVKTNEDISNKLQKHQIKLSSNTVKLQIAKLGFVSN